MVSIIIITIIIRSRLMKTNFPVWRLRQYLIFWIVAEKFLNLGAWPRCMFLSILFFVIWSTPSAKNYFLPKGPLPVAARNPTTALCPQKSGIPVTWHPQEQTLFWMHEFLVAIIFVCVLCLWPDRWGSVLKCKMQWWITTSNNKPQPTHSSVAAS